MSELGYRGYVQPHHPVLSRAFPDAPPGGRPVLDHALASLGKRFAYRPWRGLLPFEEIDRALDRPGGRDPTLNCLTLACLLASQLRGRGFSAQDVFVALGEERSAHHDPRLDFHAWIVVRCERELLWIDSAKLEAEPRGGAEILDSTRVFVLFNDQRLHFAEADKKRVLADGPPAEGLRWYAYGRVEARTEAMLRDARVRRLIEEMARKGDEGIPIDSIDPPQDAQSDGLVQREAGRWKAGPRLVLVPLGPAGEFRSLIDLAVGRYAQIVAATIPSLQAAYQRCAPAAKFGWEEACHSVVAGVFMDVAVGTELGLASSVKRSHGEWVVWAFDGLETRNRFGVRWSPSSSPGCGFVELWHGEGHRAPLSLNQRAVDVLAAIGGGGSAPSSTRELLWLVYLKAVLRKGGRAETAFPWFSGEDCERLLGPSREGARALVTEAIECALRRFAGHPWWARVERDESLRHAALRLILEHATDRVIDDGILPPFPRGSQVTPAWGRWGWTDPLGRPTLLGATLDPIEERRTS